jgi:radical SAM superfamily enzyme YgiQ (UPF0313 family)
MPHVTLVALNGTRVREERLRELGMTLPGLHGRGRAIAELPALGLLTLAGLNPPHWTCSYREASQADDALAEQIHSDRPDLVAVSALTASVLEAYRLSQRLRKAGMRTLLGGLHATTCPDESSRHLDAVVIGEGEPVWPSVLADVDAGRLQRSYRATGPYPLEQSPIPRFDLLGDRRRPRYTLQTQRGCPLACEFCGASRLLGSFREKPVDNLVRELQAIQDRTPRPLIEFADDNTFAGSRDLSGFLHALANCNARWFTEAAWRLGERPELCRSIASAGCVQVLVGLESLVHTPTGMGDKHADWPRMLDALSSIQDAGVAVIGCFIVGCDGETRASIDRLVEFALACDLADIQISLQTPFPGTPLRRRLERQGRLLDRDWSHYTLFDVTYQPDRLTVAELEAGFRELLRTVFGTAPTRRRAAIRRRVWHNNPRLRSWASELCSAT